MEGDKRERPVLVVEGLKKYYNATPRHKVKAVEEVSFAIYPGETFALVGESGSGKSTVAKCILRLDKPTAGTLRFMDRDISNRISPEDNRLLRTQMQMIFQNSTASLNPRKTIGNSIAEGLDIHRRCRSKEERLEKIREMLIKVGLTSDHAACYPHQLSGGQRQRVGIARAMVMNPRLILADECISGLDVSIQAQIVNVMKDLQQETKTAYLFIAHDLSMVNCISDRIGVLHMGHLLEIGTTKEIFSHPIHPYTKSLLSAVPLPDPIAEKKRVPLGYSYSALGIDYGKGEYRKAEGSHMVKCTEREFERWC